MDSVVGPEDVGVTGSDVTTVVTPAALAISSLSCEPTETPADESDLRSTNSLASCLNREVVEERLMAVHLFALKRVFGHDSFRGVQEAALLQWSVRGQDSVVVWRTGGGKSALFGIPAVVHGDLTVVVLPLISLIEDVFRQLVSKKIGTVFFHHQLTAHETKLAARTLLARSRATRVVLVSPEKVTSTDFMNFLSMVGRPLRFVIDEAHCIIEWGDFRSAYARLSKLKERFPRAPLLAMTGTASLEDTTIIRNVLGIAQAKVIMGDTVRNELSFHADDSRPALLTESIDKVLPFLAQHENETGIIFVASVRAVEATVGSLRAQHPAFNRTPALVDGFHSQLDYKVKRERGEGWAAGRIKVIVATSAFGMGINNVSCRFVIHLQLPASMVSLQQESGRAGRDGNAARCYILASRSDHALWAPIFSNSARQHIVVANNNVPPPGALFCSETIAITAPRHQRLEEVWLFSSLPYCRRWMLSVSVSEACALSTVQRSCVESPFVAKCDICARVAGKLGRRVEVTQHAQVVLDIAVLAQGRKVDVTYDDLVAIFSQASRAAKADPLAALNTYRASATVEERVKSCKPTQRLAQFLISLLIVRGHLFINFIPPDLESDEPVDHWKRHRVLLTASNATAVLRPVFAVL